MNAADCLLVTSDAEGSPTVVQEALASNLPVVSVDVGDIPERLEGVTCSRIVARDPSALAQAVAELLDAPRRSDGRRKAGDFCSRRIVFCAKLSHGFFPKSTTSRLLELSLAPPMFYQ